LSLFLKSHRERPGVRSIPRLKTPAAAPIDPNAVAASSAIVGAGSYVNAGSVIGACAEIGEHVVNNRLAGIGHHGRIGSFVSVGSGAAIAGQFEICDDVLFGAGAVVMSKVKIGGLAPSSAQARW